MIIVRQKPLVYQRIIDSHVIKSNVFYWINGNFIRSIRKFYKLRRDISLMNTWDVRNGIIFEHVRGAKTLITSLEDTFTQFGRCYYERGHFYGRKHTFCFTLNVMHAIGARVICIEQK